MRLKITGYKFKNIINFAAILNKNTHHIMFLKSFSLAFSLLLICSCSEKKASSSDASENSADTIPSEVKGFGTQATIKEITGLAGKKPTEVNLFEKYQLYSRLEKLLGNEYSTFKKDWNEETPIVAEGEFIYFSGCKAKACKENRYVILIDLTYNNINVVNFKNTRHRSFEESSIIGLSYKMEEYIEKIRKEQGL